MGGVDLNWMEHFSEFFRGDAHEYRQDPFRPTHGFRALDDLHADRQSVRQRSPGPALSCAEQYRAMAFAQLTYRESLRDIEACLSVQASNLYHMGFRRPVRRSTLADANERRDWRIHAELAQRLITVARKLYAGEELGLELTNTVYALDSTTHRSVPVGLSVGALPCHQSGCEDAHIARPAGQRTEFHPYLGRQAARRSCPRYADTGSRSDLRRGSWLRRLCPPSCVASSWGLLRHPRQIEHGCSPRLFGGIGSPGGHRLRPDHLLGRHLHQDGLSRTSAAHPLQRPRVRQDVGVHHQQLLPSRCHHLRPLQKPLASGALLQVDQATSSDQAVLRNLGKRGEDADLDRRLGLRPRRHRQEAPRLGRLALHFATDPLADPLRENASTSSTYQRRKQTQPTANNQPIESIRFLTGH